MATANVTTRDDGPGGPDRLGDRPNGTARCGRRRPEVARPGIVRVVSGHLSAKSHEHAGRKLCYRHAACKIHLFVYDDGTSALRFVRRDPSDADGHGMTAEVALTQETGEAIWAALFGPDSPHLAKAT
jgi:hypothetical protein